MKQENLQPKDEPRTKVCPECAGVMSELSACCGAPMDSDILICSDCKEHSDFYECDTCNGTGEVIIDENDIETGGIAFDSGVDSDPYYEKPLDTDQY